MLYPLKFHPIFKSPLWGGHALAALKQCEATAETIGESWEISQIRGNESVVANGALAGNNITELIEQFGSDLLGHKVMGDFGKQFPLLVKFIDAEEDLSIQVHPNEELARKRHGCSGKSEMWYVMEATDDASLYLGFSDELTPQEYERAIAENRITESLNHYNVEAGDVYDIPAGRVHSIGRGCLILEFQQSSDITYRIYDYDRRDAQGNRRELHTELAIDAIDLQVSRNGRKVFPRHINESNELLTTDYFVVNRLILEEPISLDQMEQDSFIIYVCTAGSATIQTTESLPITMIKGETLLVPASMAKVKIEPQGTCELLECYIP